MMRLTRYNSLIIVTLIYLGLQSPILADSANIECSLDRNSVLLGDNIILTVTVKDMKNPEAPELPYIKDFNVQFRGARQEAYSNLTLIVQGKTVERRSSGGGYMFDYILTPQRTGRFHIPSMKIKVTGQTYMTQDFDIEVLDEAEKSDDIFLDVQVNKDELFLGEKLRVDLKWYLQKDITAYRVNIPWVSGLKNFLVEDVDLDKSKNYQRIMVNGEEQVIAEKKQEFYKGQRYVVIHIQKILTPIATGQYTLDPVFLKCNVVTGYKNARTYSSSFDFFDSDMSDFFGMGRQALTKPFSTRTEPITIHILEVPKEGRTQYYTGAVGQFNFSLNPSSTSVKAGEPITLIMKVSGSGNFDQVQLPPIPDIESFRSYEPESKMQMIQEDGVMKGEKIFEKILVPTTEGIYTLPKITFEYFDPASKLYHTQTRGPLTFNVSKAELPESDIPILTIGKNDLEERKGKEIKILKKDIRYIKTTLEELQDQKKDTTSLARLVFGFLTLPPAILLLLFITHRKTERLKTDTGYARHNKAMRNAKAGLHQSKKAAKDENINEFNRILAKTFHHYLCDKLNLPRGCTYHEILDKMNTEPIKPELRNKIEDAFEYFDLVRFSAMKVDKLLTQDRLDDVERIIQKAEKELQ